MTTRPGRAVRALIVSRTFTPEVNAAAFRLGALAGGLRRSGADVEVITSVPPRALRGVPEPSGIRVRRWPVLRDAGGNVRGYVQYLSFDLPLLVRLLFRRFDVLVSEAPPTTGLISALVAAVRRRPLVYYAADVWTDGVAAVGSPAPVVGVMRMLERAVLTRSTRILSVSPGVDDRLVGLGADPERIAMIGHGIDTEVFRPDGPIPEEGRRYFVYTGTMSEVHAPQIFVRAFAAIAEQHPDVDLRFYGQGVHVPELQALAERLIPGRAVFGGVVPPQEAAQWLRGAVAALVSLTPGIGYDFAHPTKAYAAAACGTPILYTGAEPFGRIIREAELGEWAAYDVDAVAEGMGRLLTDAAAAARDRLRPERAQWAREHVSLAAVADDAAAVVTAAASRFSRGSR